MFEDHSDTIYAIIKSSDLIDPTELDEMMSSLAETGKSLADMLIDSEVFERDALLTMICTNYVSAKRPSVLSSSE